ncbi:MAG: ABC transporter permease, partial [Clostridia bacterium]|nr:ABC transporter permease [Clostridia bacterium]
MESRWERVSIPEGEAERLFTKSRTFAGDVWFRFRRKPTALAGLILVAFMLVFALIGPILSPYSYSGQDTKMANIPPVMTVYPGPGDSFFYVTQAMKVSEVDAGGHLIRQLRKKTDDSAAKRISFTYSDDTLVYLDYSKKPFVMLDQQGQRI